MKKNILAILIITLVALLIMILPGLIGLACDWLLKIIPGEILMTGMIILFSAEAYYFYKKEVE